MKAEKRLKVCNLKYVKYVTAVCSMIGNLRTYSESCQTQLRPFIYWSHTLVKRDNSLFWKWYAILLKWRILYITFLSTKSAMLHLYGMCRWTPWHLFSLSYVASLLIFSPLTAFYWCCSSPFVFKTLWLVLLCLPWGWFTFRMRLSTKYFKN